jgi:hypothetical protein
MKTFYVRIWTGPTLAESIAQLTGMTAGTQAVYGFIEADNIEAAAKAWLARAEKASLSGFKRSDVQCEDRGAVLTAS